jgi:pimeloyl-ACP methyl ester carboxylesterase
MATKTVFFVHGNFVNYQCWDNWVNRYEAKGYKCVAAAYPLRDKSVQELRKIHPDPKLGKLTIGEVIAHLVNIINGLDEKPIIIGHSFGGMLTQLLVNKGLGAAAVSIDSVPPQGVLTSKLSFFRSLWPIINPLNPPGRPYLMPFSHFQYTFVNGMAFEDQRIAYDAYVVPESVRLGRGGLSGKARVDFKKAHAPLLLIGGEKDHIMPAALNKTNFKRYKASAPSITEYKEFPGRNHFTVIGGKGWEEVADYALSWAESQLA